MQPISSIASQDLTWTPLGKWPLVYELRAGEMLVAALRRQQGSLAVAIAAVV